MIWIILLIFIDFILFFSWLNIRFNEQKTLEYTGKCKVKMSKVPTFKYYCRAYGAWDLVSLQTQLFILSSGVNEKDLDEEPRLI